MKNYCLQNNKYFFQKVLDPALGAGFIMYLEVVLCTQKRYVIKQD